MAFLVEDGSGVTGATCYFALATATAYATDRAHDPLFAAWLAETNEAKTKGAGIEASAYLDANWGSLYLGSKKTETQGLLFPRVSRTVLDPTKYDTIADMEAAQAETDKPLVGRDGLELAALPPQVVQAAIELAARALTARLAKDKGEEGWLKRRKVGPIEREWGSGGIPGGSYGFIDELLTQVCLGKRNANWSWA